MSDINTLGVGGSCDGLGVEAGTVDVARVSATFVVRSGDEVYVYVRGRLVMKRWLRTGVSATFHVAPAGVRWSR